jgi:spore coat protein H
MMNMMRQHLRRRGRHAAAAVLIAGAVWSTMTIRAAQDAPRVPPARPAGWNAATHGENVRPDYQRLFSMDTVHDLRIVIAPDRFRAMQDDLQSLAPSFPQGFRGFGAGGAGARGGGGLFGVGVPGQPGAAAGFEQVAAIAEGLTAACSEKAANASCSANGIEGRCTELGPGPRLCLPAGVGDLIAGQGRGFAGPGLGGPLSMISRDPMYVPVTVHHDGRVWTHVGMRYKGNSSLMMAGVGGNGKIPFRLDFDRYDKEFPEIEGQRFYGFQKLTLSSNFGDDSQIRELFVTEVFRDRGVPAARAAFYRVFIDSGSGPEYWGLYTMIEDPADGSMLDAQFGGRGGNLYKPDGPGANWTQFAAAGFPKKTNEKRADFTDVEAAIAALHAAPGPGRAEWRSALEARFDVDLFLRWLAVNTVVQNWDAYGVFAHNYYLYGDPGQQGRLRWIPWDHNFALGAGVGGFGGGAFGMFGGDDVLQTQKGSQWPLISRLMADEVYAARYREHLSGGLEGLFAPEAAAARMRQLHALIASSVVGDRGERPGHTTISAPAAFERSVDGAGGLRDVVERRHAAIRKALASPASAQATADRPDR